MPDHPQLVTLYADGGAEPNPGPGGYGVVLLFGHHRKELVGAFRHTTNNRMEITAAIKGLQALKKPCTVTLFSDSKYVVEAMSKGWALNWQAKGWKRKPNQQVINADLWKTLLELCTKHQVTFQWVKGHAGNPENERCDALSMQFLNATDSAIDTGYESKPQPAVPSPTASPHPTSFQSKSKINAAGQPCRKCSTPVEKRIPRPKMRKPGRAFFEYYFYCPNCRTMYMVEDARHSVDPQTSVQSTMLDALPPKPSE